MGVSSHPDETTIDVSACVVHVGKSASSPAIYVIDFPEHPFDIASVAAGRQSTIVTVPIGDWNANLTPWPAKGIYRGEPDFGGNAGQTLSGLVGEVIPAIEQAAGLAPERRAICGYSLGGLFALYAFAHDARFGACACLSGSVWYEGWVDYLRELEFEGSGRFAFLSIGSKEKHAAPKILHHVQDQMGECADILRAHGCAAEFVVKRGSHMSFVQERFDAGLTALDAFLAYHG